MEGSVVVVVLVVDLLQLKFKEYQFKVCGNHRSLEHDSHVWSSHESANSEEIMRFVLWSMWWDSIFQWQIEGLTVQICVRAARGHIDKFNYILV